MSIPFEVKLTPHNHTTTLPDALWQSRRWLCSIGGETPASTASRPRTVLEDHA